MKPSRILSPAFCFLISSSWADAANASPYGVSLHATIQIAPENVTRFLEWGKQIVGVVTAEPLCHFFELYQSIEDPGVISWVEDWDATAEWLVNVQLPKEYYKEYLEATEPMYIRPREVKIVSRVGPPFAFYKSWNQDQAYFQEE